jgi:hypothetical protein
VFGKEKNKMNEIKCPNCGKGFTPDKTGLAEIVKQVHDSEFEKAVAREKENAKAFFEEQKKNVVLTADNISKEKVLAKEKEIAELARLLKNAETEKELAVNKAVGLKETEIITLKSEKVQAQAEKELAVNKAVSLVKEELNTLKSQKELSDRLLTDEINRLKDHKAKQSTKLVGESLEQHCEIEFNKLRHTGFRNAYFEKDTESKKGDDDKQTKGDYIFRDFDENKNEIVSIMFEMKTEEDASATKQKNESFLDKLHKDRIKKECEYAVLVSLLEPDSDYYNSGIVDMSHKFDKMYVIRPQFFIPIITLLRNSAMSALSHKAELAVIKNQQPDLVAFEDKLRDYIDGFNYNRELAGRQFLKAIDEIDTTIKHLEKVRDNLKSSVDNLGHASKKLENLTIKKLTHGNPTMREKFEELREKAVSGE